MSEKIIKCKVCRNDIAKEAKTCPSCGASNKAPIYKKWWFWILILFVSIILAGTGDDNETYPTEDKSNVTNDQEYVETDDITVAEKYQIIADEISGISFDISDDSVVFMNEHEKFFPGNDNIKGAMSDFVNIEADYQHLAKNINKYTGELCAVGGYVVDIEEADDGSLTFVQISSYDGHYYVFYYLGTLDEVFEDTEVYVYALPLDIVTFENMGGAYTEAVMGAACYVQTEFYN